MIDIQLAMTLTNDHMINTQLGIAYLDVHITNTQLGIRDKFLRPGERKKKPARNERAFRLGDYALAAAAMAGFGSFRRRCVTLVTAFGAVLTAISAGLAAVFTLAAAGRMIGAAGRAVFAAGCIRLAAIGLRLAAFRFCLTAFVFGSRGYIEGYSQQQGSTYCHDDVFHDCSCLLVIV
jgi:hypothetical protein